MHLEPLESRCLMASVTGLYLFDAATGADIAPLGLTVNVDHVPQTWSIRAAATSDTRSMRFGLDANASYHIEETAPWCLNGDRTAADLPLGTHTVKATPYSRDGLRRAGTPMQVTFQVVRDAPPPTNERTLVWADEFNGTALSSAWSTMIWGRTYYGPVSVANGVLNLSATPTASALVSTGYSGVSFTYGYFEARMAIPVTRGSWPAFWLMPMPASGANDNEGEIDVMEAIQDAPGRIYTYVHRNGSQTGKATDTGADLSQFHTYAVDWQPTHLVWYFDGREIFRVTDPKFIPQTPHYLILDQWRCSSWGAPPDASTVWPMTLKVDYVRVFE